jgi:hypothetical protein
MKVRKLAKGFGSHAGKEFMPLQASIDEGIDKCGLLGVSLQGDEIRQRKGPQRNYNVVTLRKTSY